MVGKRQKMAENVENNRNSVKKVENVEMTRQKDTWLPFLAQNQPYSTEIGQNDQKRNKIP
jgi:hypothetical protein